MARTIGFASIFATATWPALGDDRSKNASLITTAAVSDWILSAFETDACALASATSWTGPLVTRKVATTRADVPRAHLDHRSGRYDSSLPRCSRPEVWGTMPVR